MNSKITLGKIAKELSAKSGKSQAECESILKAFFSNIGSALEQGETVKVKNFGSFKISRVESRKSVDVTSGNDTEIPEHNKVVFLPAKELAAAVNAPFEMFETIELEDSVLEDELLSAEAQGDTITAEAIEQQIIINEEKRDDLIKQMEDAPSDNTAPDSDMAESPDKTPESHPNNTEDSGSYPEPDEAKTDSPNLSESHQEPEAEKTDPSNHSESHQEPETANTDSSNISQNHQKPEAAKADHRESREMSDNSQAVQPRNRQRGFGHGFLWGIAATIAVIAIGIGALSLINGDFVNSGRTILGLKSSSDSEFHADITDSKSGHSDNGPKTEESGIENVENGLAPQENPEDATGIESGKDIADNPDNVVPTKPSDPIIYDTITKTHYLTTMAKKHYGNYHLWPYIYKENERILGHPDRIRPGTRVVIPKLSKYGVNPGDPKDIAKAKRLGIEIYARYQ